MSNRVRPPLTRWLPAFAADLACVAVFAFVGKTTHESSDANWVVLAIGWPYAAALVLAHAGLLIGDRRPWRSWPEGCVIVAVTYLLGTCLRVVSGRGIEGGFLIVSAIFLALTMLGWRLLVSLAASRAG